jgi:hypothetical protein
MQYQSKWEWNMESTKVWGWSGAVKFSLLFFLIIYFCFTTSASGVTLDGNIAGSVFGEILPNDFRISAMGPDGDKSYDANEPAVAYNSLRDEFLVVWMGTHQLDNLHPHELEIFGQRVSGWNGALIGNPLRISFMGDIKDPSFRVRQPDVVYNQTRDEYLVVWTGADSAGSLVAEEFEIFGQRLVYDDHDELISKGLRTRISLMGSDGKKEYDAANPAAAYDSKKDEYLIVWDGDDNTPPLVDNENEIYGRFLYYVDDVLIQKGGQFRISKMGPDGDKDYDGFNPDVVYNSITGEYLVVWDGTSHTFYKKFEFEIWCRRIFEDGSLDNVYPVSDMGGIFDHRYHGVEPAVTWNPENNEYLIVWWGNEYLSPGLVGEFEIFGQFVEFSDGKFEELGDNDFRISDMGPDEDTDFEGIGPDVAYDNTNKKYLVIWIGDDNNTPLVDDEFEVFGQLLDAETRSGVGEKDFRLSDMGPDGNIDYSAQVAGLAFSEINKRFLVVWDGDDNTNLLVEHEFEIFGQYFGLLQNSTYIPLVVK